MNTVNGGTGPSNPTGMTGGGAAGQGGVGGYQQIQAATGVTDHMKPPGTNPTYSFVNPADSGTDTPAPTQINTYEQALVFCGGVKKNVQNLGTVVAPTTVPITTAGNIPYASMFPNPDTLKNNQTNLGWNE